MRRRNLHKLIAIISVIAGVILIAAVPYMPLTKALVPTTLNDFTLAGSQPGQSGILKNPDQCDNCHGGYDLAVEPAFNWRGSMMAQAARDPLFFACMAIANQDAPESGDLCIRCHSTKGWLEGRSVPTNGSALTADDRQGIQCHFCHKLVKPSPLGVNPYPGDPDYTSQTYPLDQGYLATLLNIPPASANGMYVADNADARRGPFIDAAANHSFIYSPFHSDASLCGTCHDVSNPVYNAVRDGSGNIIDYTPNPFDQPPPSFSPYDQFPIERTYSEWLMSQYNTPGGISGTWFGGNKPFVSTCQDCHMKDVTGKGCNKSNAPIRTNLPHHDMTGGNTFIPGLINSVFPGEADQAALQAGVQRATAMLQHAASVELTVSQMSQAVSVRVTNETGHKLPSGYPEGRRIWLNLKAFNSQSGLTYESGHYDEATGYLNKTGAKVYEVKPGLSPGLAAAIGLTPGESFHFVINDTIYSDNRIPPRGFTNANFKTIQSPVIGYTYADGQYWDITNYNIPFIPDSVSVTLYYQTLSKEYVTFLRDENVSNNWGQVLYDLWNTNGKSAPVVMQQKTWKGTPVSLPPVADFMASITTPNLGQTVSFTDLTTNIPTSWSWSFSPNTVTYVGGTNSLSQNPQVTFNAPGFYTISLTATNAAGSDTEVKTDYIYVTAPPVADFMASNTTPYTSEIVTFTDLSTNNPVTWLWSFVPNMVTYTGGTSAVSQNPQVTFDAPGYYTVSLTVTNAAGSDTETKNLYIYVMSPFIQLDLTAYLEGPFTGTQMSTFINTFLPLSQPYAGLPWYYAGTENVPFIPGSNVVDWILVELRETTGDASTATADKMIACQAGFLLDNGEICSIDGISDLRFNITVTDNLYVVIWHRNHLGIMSAMPLSELGGIYTYDFSTGSDKVYGGALGYKMLTTGIWGMYAGDGDADGQVTNNDKNLVWKAQVGLSGYYSGDFNMDSQVSNIDKNSVWKPNAGKGSQIPQ